MEKICVYNFLDGNNLCNIFANLIVNKISKLVPDSKTEITVVNVRNFFVVIGKTSSETLINIAEIFQNFLNTYNEELSKKVRVFDLITYSSELENVPFTISLERKKLVEQKRNSIQSMVNDYAKKKTYFNIKVNTLSKIIYYDCVEEQISDVITILETEFPNYSLVKSDFSTEVYMSESFYGKTNHNDRPYRLLTEQIVNHLFMLGISNDIHLELSTELNSDELDNENINLKILNNNNIVKSEWLESLLLDVFPYDKETLSKEYSDSDDLTNYVINNDIDTYTFGKLSKINDFILF